MLEFLYAILIAPIEYGMQWVFEKVVDVTGSYGWAIILLSFVVTIVVAPLYHLAETWQNAERLATQKVAAKADEIKAVFKGQERFMMLRTLYRQNQYHPIMAVRTSFGFLIQIPFFFAAFKFLGNYAALEGQSFLIFDNLAKPDALFSAAGFSLNVMPFVMTFMNLGSAYIYGNNLSKKDNIQLYVIAAVFLVLLYTSPVALVLYWTINNFFSLIKNLIYQKFGLLGESSSSEIKSQSLQQIADKPRSFYDGILLQEKITKYLVVLGDFISRYSPSAWLLFIIGSFAVYGAWLFSILKTFFEANQSNELSSYLASFSIKLSLVLSLYLAVVLFGKVLQTFKFNRLHLIRFSILLVIAFFLVFSALSYQAIDFSFSPVDKLLAAEKMLFSLLFLLLALIRLPKVGILFFESTSNLIACLSQRLYFAALFLITSLIFIHSPIALLVTDLSVLQDLSIADFLINIFTFFLISTAIFTIIYQVFPKNYKGVLTFITVCLAFSAILNTFLFTGEQGAIDAFKIQHAGRLDNKFNPVYDFIIFSLIIVGLCFTLRLDRTKELFPFLILLHVSLAVISMMSLMNIDQNFEKKAVSARHPGTLPDYNQDLLSFSKEGQNVVILMLDMFSGDNMQPMLDEFPEFYDLLDGFIWYPNTLSAGSATLQGEPGIHGGHYFTPIQVNLRKVDSLENEIARGYQIFANSFGEKGFDVVFAGLSAGLTTCENVKKYLTTPVKFCGNRIDINRDYLNYWLELSHNNKISNWYKTHKASNISMILPILSFFKAAPYTARRHIYGSRSWMGTYDVYVNDLKTAISHLSTIDSFSTASNINSKKDTFKYIQSASTHFPYALTSNCQRSDRKSTKATTESRESDESNLQYIKQTTCVMRLLVNWMNWLKTNEVYDNTKIIMVSDHGYRETNSIGFIRAHALMLVKDFNSSGLLISKDTFLSNADTPSIACSAIGGCENIIPDPTKYPIENRTLFFTHGPWNKGANNPNKYIVQKQYEVKNSIFDPTNWKSIK